MLCLVCPVKIFNKAFWLAVVVWNDCIEAIPVRRLLVNCTLRKYLTQCDALQGTMYLRLYSKHPHIQYIKVLSLPACERGSNGKFVNLPKVEISARMLG